MYVHVRIGYTQNMYVHVHIGYIQNMYPIIVDIAMNIYSLLIIIYAGIDHPCVYSLISIYSCIITVKVG